MRLFLRAAEDVPLGLDLDMEGKVDQEQIDDEYPYWDTFAADFWRIENTIPQTGAGSSSIYLTQGTTRIGTLVLPTTAQSNSMTLEMQMRIPTPIFDLSPYRVCLGVEDTSGSNQVWFCYEFNLEVGENRVSLFGDATGVAGSVELRADAIWTKTYWLGVKMETNVAEKWAKYYYDYNSTGTWTYAGIVTWVAEWTPPWEKVIITAWAHNNADTMPYDRVYIDNLVITPGPTTGEEITGVNTASCSKRMQGMGAFSAKISDHELANYTTNKEFIWVPIEIWDNELEFILGEYYCIRPQYTYKHAMLAGPEALRVVDRINAGYNATLASGEVTALGDDTPPTIDDENAAFTADMIGKFVMFTDAAGPSVETAYPAVASDHKNVNGDAASTLSSESGAYTDIDTEDYDTSWHAIFHKTVATEFFYHQMEFVTTNGASTTAFDLRIRVHFSGPDLNKFGDWDTLPSIYFYDFDAATWRKVEDISWSLFSPLLERTYDESDIPAGVISDYFSGDASPEFHIKILSGESTADDEYLTIQTYFAELKITHTGVFTAEDVLYEIDARTATQLTFTGQTPTADGLAIGDRYSIGDYLHNIMESCFLPAGLLGLTLDYDASTIGDAGDYRSTFIGDVFRNYARLDDRKYWQQIGWTAQCKNSYTSTGLTISEADFVQDIPQERWTLIRDGDRIVRHVQVMGGGNFAEGYQTPSYGSPQSVILNDNRITNQTLATNMVSATLTANSTVKETLRFTLNMNSATDYTMIDIGKTLTVDAYGSKIVMTNAIITEIYYRQEGPDRLLAELVVETP